MKRLLFIGDSPTVNTGFGTVAAAILDGIKQDWEICVLGINYYGDYHSLQHVYRLYTTGMEDPYGLSRIPKLLKELQPDCILMLNDPWVCCRYLTKIRSIDQNIPVVVYTPVDSLNLQQKYVNPLNQATCVVAYTQFGIDELINAGLNVPYAVIPHGVDTDIMHPVDQVEARDILGLDHDSFFILNVDRNSPRKRLDVALYIFAEWLKKYPHDNARFYYHGALKDEGIDVVQFADYLGIVDRLNVTAEDLHPSLGIKREAMKYIYSMADVFLKVCGSEGWGLTLHEAMACKVPCIVPDYSALSEWPKNGVFYVPVDDIPSVTPNALNTVHKLPNIHWTIEALEILYQDAQLRKELGERGYNVATQDRFQWSNVAQQFNIVLHKALEGISITNDNK